MLYRISPLAFVKAHFKTFTNNRTGKVAWGEIFLQFFIAIGIAYWHLTKFTISTDAVGVVVSAASIVAGLMLNLMVLIYTLLVTKVDAKKTTETNFINFRKLCEETLANIAFSVFVCLILVLAAILKLGETGVIADIGHFFVIFSSVFLVIALLVVLKRCYSLIDYNIGAL